MSEACSYEAYVLLEKTESKQIFYFGELKKKKD